MEPLDGNAIAGVLQEVFATEMTTVTGVCKSCGTPHLLAELRIYMRGPGAVARCPSCGNVVLVLVDVRGTQHAHLDGIDLIT